jgi:hypothetical protein
MLKLFAHHLGTILRSQVDDSGNQIGGLALCAAAVSPRSLIIQMVLTEIDGTCTHIMGGWGECSQQKE